MRYSVEDYPDALIVRGEIPVTDFLALSKRAERQGLTTVDFGLASALHATLVVVSEAGSERLRAEHEASIAHLEPLERWLRGYDTGTSSLTMAHAMFGTDVPLPYGIDRPCDPDDFGRCVRFLEAVPGARDKLSAVAEAYPEWAPLIREWPALEALYHEELPSGHAPRLYARIKELLAEGDAGDA